MNLFEEIKTGLNEAIEYEKGNLKATSRTISISPIESFSSEEIKEIRKSTGLTQVLFANYLGVSLKTVEAWESGRNHPNGSACRILAITKNNPMFPKTSGIVM